MRGRRQRARSNAHGRIGNWKQLGVLLLLFLDLSYLLMIQCSEFLKSGVRIGF
jgi:hypothetical protein